MNQRIDVPSVLSSATPESRPLAELASAAHQVAVLRLARVNPFQLGPLLERLLPQAKDGPRVRVRRPEDHLVLDLLFDNLRIEPDHGEGARLVREDASRRGVLIVEFPPQSFGEEAFLDAVSNEAASKATPPEDPVPGKSGKTADKQRLPLPPTEQKLSAPLPLARIRMSGPSRLAFTMPTDVAALPFTLDAVLAAMRDWPMNLDVNARLDEDYPRFWGLPSRFAEDLRGSLLTGLRVEQRAGVDQALRDSARRIAELAAGGLQATADDRLGAVVWGALEQESAVVFAHYPELREGDLHTATLGTLALDTATHLSQMADTLRIDPEARAVFERLPYLPLLIGNPHPPARSATALELPYRLFLSPIGTARWQHGIAPATQRGRTELWHTRLGDPAPAAGAWHAARVRALWSPDFDDPDVAGKVDPPRPFRMSLDAQDRQFLVKLMAEWNQKRADRNRVYLPQSSEAKRLHLSSLGALLDAGGDWDPRPEGVDLEQWRHLATLGRDHYVRVVYSGFLVPFGHAASLVKVTERKFESLAGKPLQRIAVLRQRFFIIVRERVRSYDGSKHKFGGRNFPFSQVEVLTQVTPNLAAPKKLMSPAGADNEIVDMYAKLYDGQTTARMAFLPSVGSAPFRFEIAAIDRDGRRVSFALPLLFVSEIVNKNKSGLVNGVYNAEAISHRQAELGGASLRFNAKPGESRLATSSMRFRAGDIINHSPIKANFFPEMDVAEVRVPSLQKLLGRDDAIEMKYPDVVRDDQPNSGQIFLAVAKDAYPLDFGGGGKAQTDALGGLAAPQMAVYGLSMLSGPVSAQAGRAPAAALGKAIAKSFDPKDFFPADAKLIGGISLRDLITSVVPLDDPRAPRMLSSEFESSFDWNTPVTQPDPLKLLIPNADPKKPGTHLLLQGKTIVSPGDPQGARREAHATLDNFKLNLFGCIILWFEKLEFDARPGQKPDVSVQLRDGEDAVQFGGPLEFVNDLRKFIPSNGFSDPPALNVTPSGISAGYSLALPSIGVGIFTLSNVTLGAGFNLPFDNRPVSVRFNFAERQRPFSLIVSLLGGGGFFAIAVGAKGVQEIEAALEFGAEIALNLVVASGMVEIKAGVYFHWKDDGTDKLVVLAGYVRIHGELTIVCIFSASLTFNLQLAYEKNGNASIVYGEAELIVEVEVLFLSFDVPVRCRREFGGGEADPKFLDLIPDQGVWDEFCAAYAPEVV